MEKIAGRPAWELSFDEDGHLVRPEAADELLREVADEGVTDLVCISHGWNNGPDAARRLYSSFLPLVADAFATGPSSRSLGFLRLHWPAIWWPEGGGPGSAPARSGDAQSLAPAEAARAAEGEPAPEPSGVRLAAAVAEGFGDLERRTSLERLGALIDEGEAAAAGGQEPDADQRARLEEFHAVLAGLLPPGSVTREDAGELAFLDRSDPTAYVDLARAFGSVPQTGDAQGAGDLFRTVWKGAKDGLRVFSYYTMKARAGVVGKEGLGPLLVRLRTSPGTRGVRVHLVGHSFGARLVSFALAGIPSADESPVASLVLVQGAFSHFSFSTARGNPFGKEGALRPFADRVHGPLVATWSEHDWAVGRWYPKASALARQDNQDNPRVSRWGAVGAGGFQAVEPLARLSLESAGHAYGFTPGGFYAVEASRVIDDHGQSAFSGAHSDIHHPEVAWLVASAASG